MISTKFLFKASKIALVSVINDLATDQRVFKTCSLLVEKNFTVTLIGRKLPASARLPAWPFKTRRLKLLFTKGPAFYLFFNLRLFFVLLFSKADLLYANDLDTLLPNFLVARIRGLPLVYDSHEIFCEVPELRSSDFKRKIWQRLEAWIVPRLKYAVTVNDSIARYFENKYAIPFVVVRNMPPAAAVAGTSRAGLKLPADQKIIILQGAGLNMERGAEELVQAMAFIPGVMLLIIGAGDVWKKLEEMIAREGFANVRLMPRMSRAKLQEYTSVADIGLSIDKNTNLNYFYSLPNKLFDYIQAGTPVLASRLPEVEAIVSGYGVGEFIQNHDPEHIAKRIREMLSSPALAVYRRNCEKARLELSWENEKIKLSKLIDTAVGGR